MLPKTILQREFDRFSEIGGQPAVRTDLVSSATVFAVVNTSTTGQASVVLGTGISWIGLATVNVSNQISTVLAGNVTLNPSPNFIGLVTIANNVSLVEPVSVDDNASSLTVDWLSGATVAVSNLPNVTIGAALPAGANYIGLATVNVGNNLTLGSNVTLNPSNAYIGLASVNVGGTLPALSAGANYVGLASVNIGGTLPALSTGAAYVGLASVNVGGINSGKTFNIAPIALAATNLSGATIMVSSASKKWYINSLILSMASVVGITLLNGPTYLAGNASVRMNFASQGGLTQTGNEFPVLQALVNQTNFLIATDTASPVAGYATWWEE